MFAVDSDYQLQIQLQVFCEDIPELSHSTIMEQSDPEV